MRYCLFSAVYYQSKTPEEIVELGRSRRLDAVEWVTLHRTTAERLRKLSEDAGLEIVTHTTCKDGFVRRSPNALDEFKESLEDAVIMGAPVLMVPTFGRVGQVSLAEDRKEWTEYFAQILPLAQAAGVTLTLECTGNPDSPILTSDEALEVLHAVPGLKFVFDNGNMAASGEDSVQAYRKLEPYIVRFHMKDCLFSPVPKERFELIRGRYFATTLMGTGDLDLRGFWKNVSPEQKKLPVSLETRDYFGSRSPDEVLDIAKAVFAYEP